MIGDDAADQRMAGASGVIAYLPWVLVYPLRGYALPVLLLLWVLFAIGSFALLVLAVAMIWTAHYAIRIIEHTSFGHATPPAMKGDALALADAFTWAACFAPISAVAAALYGWPPAAITILLVLVPAHWIVLATTRSFLESLNPLRLVQVMWVTSPTYIVLLVTGWLLALLVMDLEGRVPALVAAFAWLYLVLAGCHLLGFLAYRNHEALHIPVRVVEPSRQRELEREQEQRLDVLVQAIAARMDSGDLPAAARAMFAAEPGPADAHRFHEDLLDRLKTGHRTALVLAQSARLIGFLVDRRLAVRAIEVFQDALDLDDRFRVESPLQYEPLLAAALEGRREVLAQRLLASARAMFPGDPSLRLLDASELHLLMEIRKDDAAARRAMEAIPDLENHPHAARLRPYARILRL